MTETPPAPLTKSVALFEQSATYMVEAVSGLTDEHLTRPTPCADWNLRPLLLHIADAADGLAGLAGTGELSFPTPPRTDDADPVTVAHDRVRRLFDVVESAGRRNALADEQRRWATTAAHAGAIELAAHAWDVYMAVGEDRPIPTELATELLELATSLIDDDSREPRFGPVVSVLPTATPSDRFIAFLGRRPGSGA
ncbi:maleylpyruvate isomerase family mycothiol-dependent enzyme [Haloechinothrix halophila]|uniref:maleylpyruvate isomerase family mycothiol-dependent enzyme n=1 Tax=Haloechinothrix halophila TaxID=1069073 RepID=UPI0004065EBA|nr:maleylpyruvate isomerase family mycothiol-dependent enzyme [Haloechinothrix halophila]